MSGEKINVSHGEHDLERNGALNSNMTTVTLTPAQFEALYLQPQFAAGRSSLAGRVGNPSPLFGFLFFNLSFWLMWSCRGVTSFLLAHVPLAMDLLGFQGTDGNSGIATLGAFYACAGIGLYISAVLEWSVGNTFPMVVFGSFGGFWTSYAILIQPTFRVAAAFAPANMTDSSFAGVTATAAGAATRSYNSGVGMYFVTWTVMCVIYTIAATRTNLPFFMVFLSLTVAFSLLSAAHFHTGVGELNRAATEFKVAGGFAFITGLAGLWIDLSLILKAVDFPFEVPVMDLSGLKFMQPRRVEDTPKKRVD